MGDLTSGLQHLTGALSAIGKGERHNFIVTRELDLFHIYMISICSPDIPRPVSWVPAHVIKDDQRSVNTANGVVADAGLDGGHPGVDKIGHGGRIGSSADTAIDAGRGMGVKAGGV